MEMWLLVYAEGGNIQEPILMVSEEEARKWVEDRDWNSDDDAKLFLLRDGVLTLVDNYKDVF